MNWLKFHLTKAREYIDKANHYSKKEDQQHVMKNYIYAAEKMIEFAENDLDSLSKQKRL
jgi:hypothetical protein